VCRGLAPPSGCAMPGAQIKNPERKPLRVLFFSNLMITG
jgi:hypothetical protein